MTRYLSGLCVAGLGLCGGGWLIVAAVAFGGESAGPAGRVNLLTGVGLVAVSGVSLLCWASAWRRRMRLDGVLADRSGFVSRRDARRNRRELSRSVGRAARLAKRSARDARRPARRTARRAVGGVLSSGEGVLSTGAALGSVLGGDGPYSVAVSPAEAAERDGERSPQSAVELLTELRAMLVPLLTAAGDRSAGGPPAMPAMPAASPGPDAPVFPAAAGAPPSVASPAVAPPAASPRPLPRRIPLLASVSPSSAAAAERDDPRFAADSEEAWW